MTTRPPRRRGQPLLVLGAVMLCWVSARAVISRTELGATEMVPLARAFSGARAAPRLSPNPAEATARVERPAEPAAEWARATQLGHGRWSRVGAGQGAVGSPALPPSQKLHETALAGEPRLVGIQAPLAPAIGQTSGDARLGTGQPSTALSPFGPSPVRNAGRGERRWSADAWLLLRSGGGAASAGPSVATYGASQVGAVLRYRLWPGNAHRPTGYVRVSAALNGSGEREAALGVSVRPLTALPVFVAGEGRVGHLSGRIVVRPAVMAVTELPPITLPMNARAEFYVQGGYVGGQGATPFIDGQLRIDRRVARAGAVEVRAGGGAWGGAQRGAGRLDLGPAVTLQAALGPAAMRLGLDWRFRLMGDAEPASGPALTISAGF